MTDVPTLMLYQGAQGRGTRHVVYWNHPHEAGAQPLKVNLIIYENDVMQVRFTSYHYHPFTLINSRSPGQAFISGC